MVPSLSKAGTPTLLFRERSNLVKIYVGNLPRDITEDELRQEFEAFGKVDSVNIVRDRYSGQPRGFGFVEMATKTDCYAAIKGLKGKVPNERTLDVAEAHPRPDAGRFSGPHSSRRGSSFRGGGESRRY